ncbi:hypothetical protein FKM82_019266 [Ascaphus truei]
MCSTVLALIIHFISLWPQQGLPYCSAYNTCKQTYTNNCNLFELLYIVVLFSCQTKTKYTLQYITPTSFQNLFIYLFIKYFTRK